MRLILAIFASLCVLTACTQPTVVRDRINTVSVPVIQKCASERPPQVVPIDSRYSAEQWELLSFKQKVETVAAQGLKRMNHSDELNAATSAC